MLSLFLDTVATPYLEAIRLFALNLLANADTADVPGAVYRY